MKWLLTVIFSLAFSTAISARDSEQPIILGVLEEHTGHYVGEPNYRVVRVVFAREGTGWRALPNNCRDQECVHTITSAYPHEIHWTVAFDGKKVGQITSQTPEDFRWYSDVGQQKISSKEVPSIGERSSEFGGYTEASVHRPLMADSQPYFADPDSWKPQRWEIRTDLSINRENEGGYEIFYDEFKKHTSFRFNYH